MVVEVVVGVKARQTVDPVAGTAQEVTVAAAAEEEEEVEAMETMEMGTEVEVEAMEVQAVLMVATGMGMAQDLARKIHS
jgi:hypothetical protein